MEPLMLSVRATPRTPNTPRTPRASKKHHSKYDQDDLPTQRFKVGYQKVTLDIDLEQNTITGETEISILPQDTQLKQIKLDCRGIQINSIIVNQRRAQFSYDDFLQNQEYMNDSDNSVLSDYTYDPYFDSNSNNITFKQHAMLRSKFFPLFSDQNDTAESTNSYPACTSELTIKIPESIKLRLQNSSKLFSPVVGTNRTISETPNTTGTFLNSDKVYTPLTVKISYVVKNSKNGINFHGGAHTNIPRHQWYCYTLNNDIGCSTSSWVPCVDTLYEKPAWDINIIVPNTVGDIGTTKLIGTREGDLALKKLASQSMGHEDLTATTNHTIATEETEEKISNDENLISDIPIKVVVPDIVSSRESPHTMDIGKKVVNFQFYNPVCAHHLGFAVGCFESIPVTDIKNGSDELNINYESTTNDPAKDLTLNFDATNSNKVPTLLYFQPGKKEEVINSTIFLYKALDFYSKEFSSFPFTSYTILFIDGLSSDICSFAGMTIASSKLLYKPNEIEPLFSTTEKLSIALATQYSGINVLPKSLNDIWLTEGIAHYMSNQLLKKLFGTNYYKFMFRLRSEKLCDLDIGKRPLANQIYRFPINQDQDLDFIRLKAPLVLTILDRRITKTDKLFGLSRVIPKIFLQAMSNDLANGNNLSTSHFQRVCEKVAHHKLEGFFQNWVHKAGVPTLRIMQKFNKKRLFIEMSIRQMQTSVLNNTDDNIVDDDVVNEDRRETFVHEANVAIVEDHHFPPQASFSGPITVRIHEVDGSPYEHIMAISDTVTKLDIQYNTKYRRRKKDRKDGEDDERDEKEKEKESKKKDKDKTEVPIKMLGDVLKSSEDLKNWGLKDEDSSANENADRNEKSNEEESDAFEWLRFDADSEWICNYTINLTDKNFEAQLKQDRDVSAQIESIRHFSRVVRPSKLHAKVLLQTLIDTRYYYGVRVEAAKALSKISNEDNDHIGMRLLLKAYKYLYCIDNRITPNLNELDYREYLPKPNDFSNFADLFVSQAILQSLSKVRNKNGDAPIELKRILLNILKYIDNSTNNFDDSRYYCSLIESVCNLVSISNTEISSLEIDNNTKIGKFNDAKEEFIFEAIKELNRCLKLDEWSPSKEHRITNAILKQKIKLVQEGLARIEFVDLLKYTVPAFEDEIRLTAFGGLLQLGGFRNANVLNFYFTSLRLDESVYLKYQLNKLLVRCIGAAAYKTVPSLIDDIEFLHSVESSENGNQSTQMNRFIQIEDTNSAKMKVHSRLDELAKHSIDDSINALRNDLGLGKGLSSELWNTVHSCLVPINTRRNIFDIMMILYEPKNMFMVSIDSPSDKKIVAKVVDKELGTDGYEVSSFVISFKREARFKIQIPTLKLKAIEEKPKKVVLPQEPVQQMPRLPIKIDLKEPLILKNSEHVFIEKSAKQFGIRIKHPSLVKKSPRVMGHIIRHNTIAPLRYCKINMISKTLYVSTNDKYDPDFKPSTKMVKFKVDYDRLKHMNEKNDEKLPPQLVKVESTTDVASAKVRTHKHKSFGKTPVGHQEKPSIKLKLGSGKPKKMESLGESDVGKKKPVSIVKSEIQRPESTNIFGKLNAVKKFKTPSPVSKSTSPTPFSRSRSDENDDKSDSGNSSSSSIKLKLK